MQNDQEIFADNAAPFNTIKLLSVGVDGEDGCVKKHIVDIAASKSLVQKKSQINAQATKSVTIVKQESTYIYSIAMSNDTHTLFVADGKYIITQFQKEDSSLNYYPVRVFKGHTLGITSISHSNSKMHLLSASNDKTLRVWDLENGTQLVCLNMEQKEHQKRICSCCWNDKDTLFSSGDSRGSVVVWSPPLSIYNTSNQFIAKCKFNAEGDNSNISGLQFQENGLDLFASYQSTGVIRLWSVNVKYLLDNKSQNATIPVIQQPKRQSERFNRAIYSFGVRGSMLVVGVWEEILSLSAVSLEMMADAVKFEIVNAMQKNIITSLVLSKKGKYVAQGIFKGTVAIFDSESGKCVMYIKNAHSWVSSIAFQN